MRSKSRSEIRQITERIKTHLFQRFGAGVDSILLYGSHARGEASTESDIDLLVLIHDTLNPSTVRASLSELIFDILLEQGELISVIVLPKRYYEANASVFLHNVRKEAIKI
ncbi:MAG: nucleotidyltransferase domain-containing protein [Armatimonadetes bacterium]|nr:MAG: nucleotidyltransferase domain-containing protein [Armatimonadota bacterium]